VEDLVEHLRLQASLLDLMKPPENREVSLCGDCVRRPSVCEEEHHTTTSLLCRDCPIMASSMGGLISLYALVEYPEIFSGAGCLSTHWPIGENPLVECLGRALPPACRHRLYFDFGTTRLDTTYAPVQQRMDTFVRAAGYVHGWDWLTHTFEGAEHTEAAWRDRVHLPLRWLLAE
jgi:enterochelin esterase-like enzyme